MNAKTDAEYQSARRARLKASGDVYLHVPISRKSKSELIVLSKGLKLTHRAVIEMLIDVGHKEMLK